MKRATRGRAEPTQGLGDEATRRRYDVGMRRRDDTATRCKFLSPRVPASPRLRVSTSPRPRVWLIALLASAVLLSGCGVRRAYNLERIFAERRGREGKRPLIVIPGILGSQLVIVGRRKSVWPSAFRSLTTG